LSLLLSDPAACGLDPCWLFAGFHHQQMLQWIIELLDVPRALLFAVVVDAGSLLLLSNDVTSCHSQNEFASASVGRTLPVCFFSRMPWPDVHNIMAFCVVFSTR